ncbi:MAG: 4Fe-4S dicluster domain-containing protein [Omnitrophica WOR_2 bacterium]
MFHMPGKPKKPDWQVKVNDRLCHFCGACVGACPANAMFLYNTRLVIQDDGCTRCERCLIACPLHALSLDRLPAERYE